MDVVVLGRSEWLYETLKVVQSEVNIKAIITSKEAPEYKVNEEAFKKIAQDNNIPFFSANFQNKGELKSFLEQVGNIDHGISVNFPYVIPRDVIDMFNIAILNAHGGDLPKYRGNACQAWAILNKEEKVGLCVHKMVGGELDSGDIIARSYLPVNLSTTVRSIYDWFEVEIPKLFLNSVSKLKEDSNFVLDAQSQDAKDIIRCFSRRPEDGNISWDKKAEDIIRLINASGEPYDGAFSFLNKEKIYVLKAEIHWPDFQFLAIPGQVCFVCDEYVDIAATDAFIRVSEISYQGKVTPVKSIFSSTRMRLGL